MKKVTKLDIVSFVKACWVNFCFEGGLVKNLRIFLKIVRKFFGSFWNFLGIVWKIFWRVFLGGIFLGRNSLVRC